MVETSVTTHPRLDSRRGQLQQTWEEEIGKSRDEESPQDWLGQAQVLASWQGSQHAQQVTQLSPEIAQAKIRHQTATENTQ